MQSWIWQASHWEPALGVPLQDRGFRFGLHGFETIRVIDGAPVFWRWHWEILTATAEATGWGGKMPGLMPPPDLAGDGVLRIYWTAGDGSPFGEPGEGRLLAAFEPAPVGRRRPLRAGICRQPLRGELTGCKTGQYGERVALLEPIRQAGLDEGLAYFEDEHVSGWCLANLLVKRDGSWRTPEDVRVRSGTTLRWLAQHAAISHEPVEMKSLPEAEALGLCNAIQGIVPVESFDGKTYPVDPQLQHWAAAFEAATRSP